MKISHLLPYPPTTLQFSYSYHFALVLSMSFDKYIMTCVHYYCILQNSFTALEIPCAPPIFIFVIENIIATR